MPIFFTIVTEMKVVELVSPADNSLVPIRPTLVWRKLGNAVSYDVKAWNLSEEKLGFEKSGVLDTSLVADSLSYNAIYYWQVRERNVLGEIGPWGNGFTFTTEKLVGVDEIEVPYIFKLSQNYPNPFNPSTKIKFSIPSVETFHGTSLQHVVLKVYDLLGREVSALINEEKAPGNYEVKFDATNLPSGVYFYRLQAGSYSQTKKLLVIK